MKIIILQIKKKIQKNRKNNNKNKKVYLNMANKKIKK